MLWFDSIEREGWNVSVPGKFESMENMSFFYPIVKYDIVYDIVIWDGIRCRIQCRILQININ